MNRYAVGAKFDVGEMRKKEEPFEISGIEYAVSDCNVQLDMSHSECLL